MNYQSVTTIQSKVSPGVRYTLHRLNPGRRATLALLVADARLQLSRALAAADRITAQPADERDLDRLRMFVDVAEGLGVAIDTAAMNAVLADIKGLKINGVPATPQSFLTDGPADLFRELLPYARAALATPNPSEDEAAQPGLTVN